MTDPALERAVHRAGRAPSSHNSQPWGLAVLESEAARQAFGVGSGRGFAVALDLERALGALPAHAIEMNLSCGMYLEALLEALGARARTTWSAARGEVRSPPGWPEPWRPLIAVEVERAEAEEAEALDTRTTNRAPFADRRVEPEVLAGLAPATRFLQPGPPPRFIDEPARVAALGDFVARHAAVDFEHEAAWTETHSFIRWTAADAERAEDGFPITQLFGPMSWWSRSFYRFALAPRTMSLLARFGYAKQIARQLGALVSGTPALVWFAFDGAEDREAPAVEAQLAGGAAVLDLWLRAERAGLAVHPVSVVLQHSEIRRALERELGAEGRVFFFARLGYPSASFPLAPRRHDPWAAVRRL